MIENSRVIRLALVGNYSPAVRAHLAMPKGLALASADRAWTIETTWLETETLVGELAVDLSVYDGIWCVPGSPYQSMEGALRAIRFARENGVPFLGTCGGFQHAVLEHVRNVMRRETADHEESSPNAEMLMISRLSCSLAGVTDEILLEPGTRLRGIYGTDQVREGFQCNFGVNPRFETLLQAGGLRICGRNQHGEVRAVERQDQSFFLATLFQPELSALEGRNHPLIESFLTTCAGGLKSV